MLYQILRHIYMFVEEVRESKDPHKIAELLQKPAHRRQKDLLINMAKGLLMVVFEKDRWTNVEGRFNGITARKLFEMGLIKPNKTEDDLATLTPLGKRVVEILSK